jgi:hypothetical protein
LRFFHTLPIIPQSVALFQLHRFGLDMSEVVRTLETGLPRLASDRDRVRSICAWPWIVNLNLKAN